MKVEEEIFNDYKIDLNKILEFGFIKNKELYIYEKLINKEKFKIIITINIDGNVNGKIIDLRLNEEYSNFRINDIQGSFANRIKEEYINLLIEIRNNCFKNSKRVNSWIIPANPKFFDILNYFKNNDYINWHQTIKVEVNDFVYIYVGSPYSSIMYKCIASKVNFMGIGRYRMEKVMELKILNKYDKDIFPLYLLKQYGLTSIRCARKMPDKLAEYLYNK